MGEYEEELDMAYSVHQGKDNLATRVLIINLEGSKHDEDTPLRWNTIESLP